MEREMYYVIDVHTYLNYMTSCISKIAIPIEIPRLFQSGNRKRYGQERMVF